MRTKVTLLVAASVALAVLLSFGIAVKDAKADAILFPWVVKAQTLSTIVSVINTAEQFTSAIITVPQPTLHYQYWYKNTTANGQTEACTEQNFFRPTSKDDIVTFDAAGNINSGEKLFNDLTDYGQPGTFDNSDPVAPRRSFLIVDNNTPGFVLQSADIPGAFVATNVDGTLYGEAIVVDITNGAAWGYVAYNASGGWAPNPGDVVSFRDGVDVLGEVIGAGFLPDGPGTNDLAPIFNETTQTMFFQPDTMTTKFVMTPAHPFNQRRGDISNRIQLCTDPTVSRNSEGFSTGCRAGGIFDAQEQPLSFTRIKDITCTTADELSLITGQAIQSFLATDAQGWAYINTYPVLRTDPADGNVNRPTANSGNGIILGKVEFNLGTIFGATTINNVQWLRDSESFVGNFDNARTCLGDDGFPESSTSMGFFHFEGPSALPLGGGINCIHNQRSQDIVVIAAQQEGNVIFQQCVIGPFTACQDDQEATPPQ